jgi:hypothetical protein
MLQRTQRVCHLINLCLNTFSVRSVNRIVKWEASVVSGGKERSGRECEANHFNSHCSDLFVPLFILLTFVFEHSVFPIVFHFVSRNIKCSATSII